MTASHATAGQALLAQAANEIKALATTIATDAEGAAAKALTGAFPSLKALFAGVASGAMTVSSVAGLAGALLTLAAELEKLGARPASAEELIAINADKGAEMPG